ncbi:lytic transglycosylase domain-containing protein [Micromonospora sp. U21]|uniref:lytic transglycosylase domain-containing protein n=1 Tax=Micromonospora sp. U21 TaxID=2824899 RepID=UPI001B3799C4|nr:lytic murein transglycosylase [Micromonospora sp. U21]MBQ0903968.1 lytic murein transglycosylase [Micromonospora sp. U21]
MGDTRRVADGEDKTRVQPLRPAAPLDGPLQGSGAAPDPVPRAVPRPRRPWLSGRAAGAPNPPTGTAPAAPTAPEPAAASPAGAPEADVPVAATKADAPAGDTKADSPAGGTEADAPAGDTKADAPAGDLTAPSPATGSDAATTPAGPDAGTSAGDAKPVPLAGAATAGQASTTVDDPASAPKSDPGRRRRVPFAHALRLPPRQAAVTAARATRAWARRPSGRLTLPGVFLLALVAATAAAGALLVPAAIRASRPVAVDASVTPTAAVPPPVLPSGVPTGPLPTGSLPTGPLPTGPLPSGGVPTGPVIGGRPSDALAGWAQQVGAKVGVPPAAMQAYGYAELVLAQTNRSCALSWTTLAAIGQVESGHGAANGARLGQDGKALPQIIGLPLDGRDGRMRIIDTDRGLLDQDTSFDRAIGPMQFIPTTWQEIGADADNDGVKDPHDLDDAALAAGNYLCKNNRNLSIPGDWWNAILSYNDVRRYAQDVYDTANRYGRASRT